MADRVGRGGGRIPVLLTAFCEGVSVLVVEIAGARAVAPYFGASLRVWTSQITATLLFLALGYALGGRLSRTKGAKSTEALPAVFWIAGLWLGLFPWVRGTVLTLCAASGVALGSFLASCLLFGPALVCLGSVSPLLIQGLEAGEEGDRAGSSAGAVFFTNTLGGLAGGWLTALALIPRWPLRADLMGLGLFLALLGSLWALKRPKPALALGLPFLLALSLAVAPKPALTCEMPGAQGVVLYSHASGVGLIQVLDIQNQGYSQGLALTVDGITQGGMERTSGLTVFEFTEYMAYLSWRYHPTAKRALLLGLGPGMLAKQLVARGMDVDVAEIEPRMHEVATAYFGLPSQVKVHLEDGRAYLRQSQERWDLIFLDAFAGENAPWYLLTQESLEDMRSHLAPGGILVVNTVTRAKGSPGLDRVEAGLLSVFPSASVWVDSSERSGGVDLVNACLLAGEDLKPVPGEYPGKALAKIRERTLAFETRGRSCRPGGQVCRDDFSDLDVAESDLRLEWRKAILSQEGAEILGD